MKRNGLILAGGILGVLRGGFGTIVGLLGLGVVGELEATIPGYTGVFVFDVVLSAIMLGIGIFAIVKSGDPMTEGVFRWSGLAIVLGGIVSGVWSFDLLKGTPEGVGSVFGSIWVLGGTGLLLLFGAARWQRLRVAADYAATRAVSPPDVGQQDS